MNKRAESLFEEIRNNNVDAFFVTATPNIRYLTGFTGEDAFLLAVNGKIFLIVDSRFTAQAQNEVFEGVDVVEYKPPILNFLKDLLLKYKVHWLGIEKNRLSAELFIE
ncbi:MAG: aminopeptidase P family N-terminal domain-containing protein, partial [Caldisericaceae bacterium]|nr:aminopeptidase P family N-terminal domain-containing protein [Caldisericaceae bacterium]